MAGKKGKSGRQRTILYTKVCRIRVTPDFRDLLSFFQDLDQLPADRRNAALLMAIRGGASTAQAEITRTESHKAARVIDAILDEFDL
jgi:hypothetical protein